MVVVIQKQVYPHQKLIVLEVWLVGSILEYQVKGNLYNLLNELRSSIYHFEIGYPCIVFVSSALTSTCTNAIIFY